MKDALEFHDSRLRSIRIVDRDAVLRFAPAYIHRSEGRPGFDAGSEWLQDLDLILSDATILDGPADWPAEDCNIDEGSLAIDATIWDNLISPETRLILRDPGIGRFDPPSRHRRTVHLARPGEIPGARTGQLTIA